MYADGENRENDMVRHACLTERTGGRERKRERGGRVEGREREGEIGERETEGERDREERSLAIVVGRSRGATFLLRR